MEGDEGRGYERKGSIESMRRARLRESSGGKQRQDCKSYRAMERDRGWIYRRCKRRGTTVNSPKKSE